MSESKSNTMYYIHCAIGCILMFLFRFLPAPAPITSLGMQMIGIFIGLIYMWSFVDTLWPSVMGLFALCLSDYGTTTSIIASSFGNSTSALMLLGLKGHSTKEAGELLRRFREGRQATECAALLTRAKEAGVTRKEHCDALVFEMVQTLETLLAQK